MLTLDAAASLLRAPSPLPLDAAASLLRAPSPHPPACAHAFTSEQHTCFQATVLLTILYRPQSYFLAPADIAVTNAGLIDPASITVQRRFWCMDGWGWVGREGNDNGEGHGIATTHVIFGQVGWRVRAPSLSCASLSAPIPHM